jgi:hypothetical protein
MKKKDRMDTLVGGLRHASADNIAVAAIVERERETENQRFTSPLNL